MPPVFTPDYMTHLFTAYGYWAVFFVVGLESIGIPLPGELIVVVASIFASTHGGNIYLVIAAAAAGAILGDNIGYMIGREFGYRLLLRYGSRAGITESHVKLGQYTFKKYGAAVVFIGRFIAVMRVLAAFLAGANRLAWPKFLIANATGGIVWASVVALSAYTFGHSIKHLHGPVTLLLMIAAGAAVLAGMVYFRHHEAELIAEAEHAMPGKIPGFRA
jgi:membrane protein DedA with SNARE-associated domain